MIINFEQIDKNILKEEMKDKLNDSLLIDCSLVLTSNIDEALKLSEESNFINICKVLEKFVNQLSLGQKLSLFYRANSDTLSNRDNLKTFLLLLEALYRDIYEYQILNNILFFKALEEKIKIIAEKTSKDDTLKHLFQILDLIKKMGYNVNMSLLMNQFLIDLNGGI
jgi:hypothetical protein